MSANIPPPDPRSAGLLEIRALALHAGPPNGRGGTGQEQMPHDGNSSDNDASWQAPDLSLLEDRRGDLPSFPVDGLGPIVGAALDRTAKGAGVTTAHVAVPLLSIASGLVGAARQVRASTSWCEPVALWTTVVGFSGTGKTPGLDVSRRALGAIEKLRKDSIEELRRDHEHRAAVAKAVKKKWKAEVAEALEKSEPPPPLPVEGEDLGPFVAPRFHVTDTTVEKLAVLLKARPRGMLVIIDELASLFVNMARYTRGSDRPFWLQCWNGGAYIVERLNRPSVTVEHLLVSLTGGLQPDKLDRSFSGDHDGLYARMLFSWPEEAPYRPLSNEANFVDSQLQEALSRLINLPAGDGPNLEPRFLSLSADAQVIFEEHRKALHDQRPRLEGREQEWCAKGPSHVLRLAGAIAFLDWAMRGSGDPAYACKDDPSFQAILRNAEEPTEIGEVHMRRAVKLWRDYFWPHAQACLRQMELSQLHKDERRVLRWLKIEGLYEVSREEIRRDALARKLDAEKVQIVLDRLVAAGWLRERQQPTAGRTKRRWEVNPLLFT